MSYFFKIMNPENEDTLLDIGSSDCRYFENFFDEKLKLIALDIRPCQIARKAPNLKFVRADACALPFKDKVINIAFSNSVIEHVGDRNKQADFVKEIKRVSKKYFIETPNKYFPIEPHYFFPFFQFMPGKIKNILRKNFSLGWYSKGNGEEINLLSKRELMLLFPGAKIITERFLGLSKSFYIIWDQDD